MHWRLFCATWMDRISSTLRVQLLCLTSSLMELGFFLHYNGMLHQWATYWSRHKLFVAYLLYHACKMHGRVSLGWCTHRARTGTSSSFLRGHGCALQARRKEAVQRLSRATATSISYKEGLDTAGSAGWLPHPASLVESSGLWGYTLRHGRADVRKKNCWG